MEQLELADWRRRVAALYARVRDSEDPHEAWMEWRKVREALFRSHPQSPLPPGSSQIPLYFDYDEGARVEGTVVPSQPEVVSIPGSSGASIAAARFAEVRFDLGGAACSLPVFWLEGYAGGLFLAFRDATSGRQSYGGGRYLLDSAKGADLGMVEDRLILDFNFSYQPSCSYSPRWACPLPMRGADLPIAVEAGEKLG